ncbi:nicotinate-nucleotide--dimethylbenzimidazole phosphoribosyltransferase [Thermodesulfobacteriota bacterium]
MTIVDGGELDLMENLDFNLAEIVGGIGPMEKGWVEKARERTSKLVMPKRALGRLHEISEKICGIQKSLRPEINCKECLIMAGDHGVVEEGVSAYPQEVTGEMIKTFLCGGAGINILASHVGAGVRIVDMGIIPELNPDSIEGGEKFHVEKIRRGTSNFVKGPAMSHEEAEQSIVAGFQLAAKLFESGIQILGTGDMGIGNTTPSAAIGAVITGKSVEDMTGRGTGVDDKAFLRKKDVIRKGIELNLPDSCSGLDVLSKIGGFEIGGIAGIILAGAYYNRPVVIDGFISTAGALIAYTLCPSITDYIFAGHCSEEPGHRIMLDFLGLKPILDLGMRLGEGTGGALAMGIMEGAVRVFNEMLTFEEAGVTDK